MQTLEPILAEIQLFRGMKPEHIALIAGCASNARFEPGAFLFRTGSPADSFWVIRQGQVALEIHAPARGALTVQTLGEGDVAGWSWVLPPYQRRFDARAVTATRALRMDGTCLRNKFSADSELGYELMSRFAQIITQRVDAMALQLLDVYGGRGAQVR